MILLTIREAIRTSSKLKGMAKNSNLNGRTDRFPTTSHIITKLANHAVKIVCSRLNFLERTKINNAIEIDQIPQIAPFTGAEGNSIPRSA